MSLNLLPETIGIPQTVELTGLARTTLFQLIRTGELASLKIGKRRLIRLASLRAFLAERERASAQKVAA